MTLEYELAIRVNLQIDVVSGHGVPCPYGDVRDGKNAVPMKAVRKTTVLEAHREKRGQELSCPYKKNIV